MSDSVTSILLAAGQGKRLGGPKALLSVRAADGEADVSLIEALCRDRLAAESSRCLAVLRPDVAALLGDQLRAAGAEVVVSTAPDALGPAGSLAAAAAVLRQGSDARALVISPVDVRVSAATVRALVDALAGASGALAAVPQHGGRRGHPITVAPSVLERYTEPDPPPLRDHLRSLGGRVVFIETGDPAVIEDLDSPEQAALLTRITGRPGPPVFVPRAPVRD